MNITSVLPRPQAWLSLKKDQISYTFLRKFTAISQKFTEIYRPKEAPEMFLQAEGTFAFPAPTAGVHHSSPNCLVSKYCDDVYQYDDQDYSD